MLSVRAVPRLSNMLWSLGLVHGTGVIMFCQKVLGAPQWEKNDTYDYDCC